MTDSPDSPDTTRTTDAVDAALAILGAAPPPPAESLPLRLWVQGVAAAASQADGAGATVVTGRLASGRVAAGDTVLFSPSNQSAAVAALDGGGENITLTLDRRLTPRAGEVLSHADAAPVETDVFCARLSWTSRRAVAAGAGYRLVMGAGAVPVPVRVQDVVSDEGGVAEVILRAEGLLALDAFEANPYTGRLALLEDGAVAGAGIISMKGYADQRSLVTQRATNIKRVEHRVDAAARARRFGHKGGVLWLTGLSGSGKSTLAVEAELRLHNMGYNVYVLDGDNVRHGLNANLGFSPEDRAENIRRVGEVAALFSRAGMVVLTAFISPYRSDRERARQAAPEAFHEVFIKADLATCESRDPKGLYKKARTGEIPDFTGISAPYEAPEQAELVVDTGTEDVAASVQHIIDYLEANFALTAVK